MAAKLDRSELNLISKLVREVENKKPKHEMLLGKLLMMKKELPVKKKD